MTYNPRSYIAGAALRLLGDVVHSPNDRRAKQFNTVTVDTVKYIIALERFRKRL